MKNLKITTKTMPYDLLPSWRLLHRDDHRQFTTTMTLIVCKETLVRRAFVLIGSARKVALLVCLRLISSKMFSLNTGITIGSFKNTFFLTKRSITFVL